MFVWTFWEPKDKIPYYLQLCMQTVKQFLPEATYIILDYSNIDQFLDVKRTFGFNLFSNKLKLMHVADCIRVAILEEFGGVWIDVDTILTSPNAKKFFIEDKERRLVSFGTNSYPGGIVVNAFLNSVSNTPFLNRSKTYIRELLYNLNTHTNDINTFYFNKIFFESYIQDHPNEFKLYPLELARPDFVYCKDSDKRSAFEDYYLYHSFCLEDIEQDICMLFNSQVPEYIKNLSKEKFFELDCTLTNILAELLDIRLPESRVKLERPT